MRNFSKYPIKTAEIKTVLLQLLNEELESESIGSTRAACLNRAIKIIAAADKMREGIERRFTGDDHLKWITPWAEAAALNDAFNKD